MLTGVTAAAIVMLSDLVAVCTVGAVESVTSTEKLVVPEAVGVPDMVPVDAFKVSPAGRAPEFIDQTKGVVPPLAARVALYAVPCCPLGSEAVVILIGVAAAATAMLKDFVAVCLVGAVESVTLTVNVNVPEAVGVPLTCPVAVFRFSPAGRTPELIDHR